MRPPPIRLMVSSGVSAKLASTKYSSRNSHMSRSSMRSATKIEPFAHVVKRSDWPGQPDALFRNGLRGPWPFHFKMPGSRGCRCGPGSAPYVLARWPNIRREARTAHVLNSSELMTDESRISLARCFSHRASVARSNTGYGSLRPSRNATTDPRGHERSGARGLGRILLPTVIHSCPRSRITCTTNSDELNCTHAPNESVWSPSAVTQKPRCLTNTPSRRRTRPNREPPAIYRCL